jgi:hypothetical protein
MFPIEIRRATPEDQAAIWETRTCAIRATCSSHYSQQKIDRWASSPPRETFRDTIINTDFFVAERDGMVVGHGFLDTQLAASKDCLCGPTIRVSVLADYFYRRWS